MVHALLLLLTGALPLADPSSILAVFPTVSKSHFDFVEPLLLALAARGHRVTTISSFPQPSSVANYTDITLRDFKKVFLNNIPFNVLPNIPNSFFDSHFFLYHEIAGVENVFSHPDVKKLLNSKGTFDLVMTELWNSDVFLGFAHKFNAPVVAVSSCGIMPWGNGRFGNPDNPSYIPSIFSDKFGMLNFRQRMENSLKLVSSKLFYYLFFNTESDRIARRVFGDSIPPLEVLARRTSLQLVNTHHSLHGPRPFSPQIVQVGGIHLHEPKPLPKNLEKWMNESADGVIYFSFGSMLRGASLPADKVKAFLQVFKTLPQRVLWKWEDEGVEGLPDNVKVMKWLPQRDVLAHPNVKVFISHGGLLGTTEAVVSGVPILGIPMYGDQPNNVAALVENGVAIHIDYNNISEASLTYAFHSLLHDKSYSDNARQLSRRFLDRPQSPLQTAVYWTEYVIRHGGAPHLQSAAVHLSWYQYYLLDVIVVCLTTLLVTLAFVYYSIRFCLRLLCLKKSIKLKTN